MRFTQNFVQNPNFSSLEIQKFRFRYAEGTYEKHDGAYGDGAKYGGDYEAYEEDYAKKVEYAGWRKISSKMHPKLQKLNQNHDFSSKFQFFFTRNSKNTFVLGKHYQGEYPDGKRYGGDYKPHDAELKKH